MEAITLTAAAITTLIFSEAVKEVGKTIGKGTTEQVARLVNIIREKFKDAGTEGLLTRVQNQPTESNKAKFQEELQTQMSEDEIFRSVLQKLIQHPELTKLINEQIIGENLESQGDIDIDSNTQETTSNKEGKQKLGINVKSGENIKISNNTQKKF